MKEIEHRAKHINDLRELIKTLNDNIDHIANIVVAFDTDELGSHTSDMSYIGNANACIGLVEKTKKKLLDCMDNAEI